MRAKPGPRLGSVVTTCNQSPVAFLQEECGRTRCARNGPPKCGARAGTQVSRRLRALVPLRLRAVAAPLLRADRRAGRGRVFLAYLRTATSPELFPDFPVKGWRKN